MRPRPPRGSTSPRRVPAGPGARGPAAAPTSRTRGPEARTLASVVLTLIGISGVCGQALGSRWVPAAGSLLLVAPQPAVFHDHNISASVELAWIDGTGNPQHLRLDRTTFARVSGPLTRRDAYIHAILGAPVLPYGFWGTVVRFGLCHPEGITRDLNLPADVRWAELSLRYASRPQLGTHRLSVSCPDPDPVEALR